MANNMQQQLQLGNVTFAGFEVPDALPNLFGTQKVAVHDFSGQTVGTRVVQQLGSFPADNIEWHGVFFDNNQSSALFDTSGQSAVQRASLVNAMRVTGQVQNLIWGPFQYTVIVHEFEVIGRLKQQLEYRIKLIPIFDNTTTSNAPPSAITPEQAVFDANMGVTNATTSPVGLLLPSPVIAAATIITQSTTAAVIASGGSVSNIPTAQNAAIQAQITALQTTLQPIINGSDYGQATAAATLSANLYALGVTLGIGQATPLVVITATNPNLSLLASQYYGNASLWPLIAQANNLQDMFPIGTYTITIPQQNTQSALIPS